MKIELSSPFKEIYKAGYLNINKEPRRLVLLVSRTDNSKTTISYARYLMSCKLNRFLDKNEHVDHIDGDKLNDVIENLQILTPMENNIKRNLQLGIKGREDRTLTCPACSKDFTRPARNVDYKIKNAKTPACSRRCGGIYSHITKNKEN